jgi:multiple sugar transport system substrate-binding protein
MRTVTALTGAGALGALSGCGLGATSTGGGAGLQLSKTPVTVRVLTRAGTDAHTRWFKTITPQAFEPAHPMIKVEYDEVSGMTIAEKLLVLAAGDSVSDVVWLGIVADGGRGGVTKGILRPLDPIVKADKFNVNVFWKMALDLFAYQGQLYGIPRTGHFGCHVAYINLDLAQKAGVKVPVADANWTTDDLATWGKQMTRPDDGQWGWQPNVGINECGMVWLRTFGGDLFSADGKKLLIDTAEAQAGLQFMADARYRYQTTENLRGDSAKLFEAGKLAIMQNTPGQLAQYTTPNQQLVKFNWAATVLPRHPVTGKRGTQFGGGSLALSKQSKVAAEGWEWIKFITSKENGVLQVAGGAGTPGGRDDVWSDPRLAAISPVYGLIQKVYKSPGPTYIPWNESYFDVVALVTAKLNDFWDGKAGLRDTVQAITREAAPLLERPPA